jgi:hypothetical protein
MEGIESFEPFGLYGKNISCCGSAEKIWKVYPGEKF